MELQRALSAVKPTATAEHARADRLTPSISNIVSTVHLLPAGLRMPRADVARLMPCPQYAPRSFAACIIKMRDRVSQQTSLVFGSGSVVTVGSRSRHHAIFRSKVASIIMARAQYARASDLAVHTLEGALRFDNTEIHNWVGHCQLDVEVDLEAMSRAYPLTCEYDEEAFPGLTCKVWLTDSYSCECRQAKCKCVLSVLIFKTGHVVIPGCRSLREVNCIFWRVRCAVRHLL